MIKKFDEWNKLKKEVEISEEKVYPKVWEMWYINLWVNVWNESLWKWKRFLQNKKRNSNIYILKIFLIILPN